MSPAQGKNQLIRFTLDIPADVYRSYYTGQAQHVVVKADDGRNVRLPAGTLRQFLTHDGVRGVFEMELDQNNKLVSIRRVVPG